MGIVARFKSAVALKVELIAEAAGLLVSVSGATVAAVFGKLIVGLVLGGLALGFLLRLKARRSTPPTLPTVRTPAWVRPAALILAAVEVAALVEATSLPIRFNQEGFAYTHWLLVVLLLWAAYGLQSSLLATWARRRAVAHAA